MKPASADAVIVKLRQMGISEAEATKLARGEGPQDRSTLSVEHRAAISRTKRRQDAERAGAGRAAG